MEIQCTTNRRQKSFKGPKLFKWFKKINNADKTTIPLQPDDNFIINYNRLNATFNTKIDINALDPRRVIFISLLGLYQTWKKCPAFVLYPAIFLLPLKKQWIYSVADNMHELESNTVFSSNYFLDMLEDEEFMNLLKWKDSQGLAFWMFDDYNYESDTDTLIHPFWRSFNQKLTSLVDPISKNNYNQLNLNETFWQNDTKLNHKYCRNSVSILSELYFLTSKFKPIQEIIYQSNSKSLQAIVAYPCQHNMLKPLTELVNTKPDLCEEFDDESKDDWFISEEYNPYEL